MPSVVGCKTFALHLQPQRCNPCFVVSVRRLCRCSVGVFAFSLSKKKRPPTKGGQVFGRCYSVMVVCVGVKPIATAFFCTFFIVLITALCVTPKYVAIALYPYPLCLNSNIFACFAVKFNFSSMRSVVSTVSVSAVIAVIFPL